MRADSQLRKNCALAALFLSVLGCGGSDPSGDDTVPQLGRYGFEAEWSGGNATGEMIVTAATWDNVDYDFTIGTVTRHGGAPWDEIEGFLIISPRIGNVGLLARFRREGNSYPCSGHSVRLDGLTIPMQCTFQYRGP